MATSAYDFSKWAAQDTLGYQDARAADIPKVGANVLDYDPSADIFSTGKQSGYQGFLSSLGTEEDRYREAGMADPRYQEAVKNWQSTADKFDDIIAAHPEILGQLNDRAYREESDTKLFQGTNNTQAYYAAQLKALGVGDDLLSEGQQEAGDKWADWMSAESQDRRAPKDGGFGMMALTFAAIVMTGGAASGILGTGVSTGSAIADGAIGGAAMGGAKAAATGGDFWQGVATGAVVGGAGGALNSFSSQLEGGTNFVGPTQSTSFTTSDLVNAGGKAIINAGAAEANGGNPYLAAGSSLVGSATSELTGSPALGQIASSGASALGSSLINQSQTTTPSAGTSSGTNTGTSSGTNTGTDLNGASTPVTVQEPVVPAPTVPPVPTLKPLSFADLMVQQKPTYVSFGV